MKIFNSLTAKKEVFKPIEPGKVKIYICGMTVYNYSHIGHARLLIIFDMVVRYLRVRGYKVTFIRNITDIDDKIIKRAQEHKASPEILAKQFIKILREDAKVLCTIPPDQEPCATQYIPEIIQLVQKLLDKRYAYIGQNSDIFFDIHRFKNYGKLSNLNLKEIQAGARVEVNDGKRNPLDFVLWKKAKQNEPKWDSPWGEGRPGWHIECSVMSSSILGQPFDIHGGGLDLKFPHHENEIAQSEAGENKPFVKLWMHAGLLEVNREKMSNSLGNIISIRESLRSNNPEVLRYFLLSGHYRNSLSYSLENLGSSRLALERFYLAFRKLPIINRKESSQYTSRFYEAMDDDFNTPIAFSILFEMVREINRLRDKNQVNKAAILATELKYLGNIFGLFKYSSEQFLQYDKKEINIQKVRILIAKRNEARKKKDWRTADQIREQLNYLNIIIEDSSEETSWRRA